MEAIKKDMLILHVTNKMALIELTRRKDLCSRHKKNWDKSFVVVVACGFYIHITNTRISFFF